MAGAVVGGLLQSRDGEEMTTRNWLVQRWSNYLASKKEERYREGFDWAAGVLLREEMVPEELERQVHTWEFDHEQEEAFDKGVLAAIAALRRWSGRG